MIIPPDFSLKPRLLRAAFCARHCQAITVFITVMPLYENQQN
jgi:hypothetical protein